MKKFTTLGFLIAAASFVAMHFVVMYTRAFILPAAILAYGGGLAFGLAVREPGRMYYQMGFVLGYAFCLLFALIATTLS